MTALDVLVIGAATLAIARYSTVFTGYPKGYDAPGHLAKMHLLLAEWPHVNWDSAWYSGSPSFSGSYPPGYHALVIVLARTSHLSLGHSMMVVAAISLLMIVLGIYGLVRAVSDSRIGALVAVALVLGGPTQWAQILQHGLYPRLLAMGCAAVAVALAASCARHPRIWKVVVTMLALAGAGSVHPLACFLGVALVVGVMVALTLTPYRTARDLTAIVVGAFALDGYFYVPFLLGSRAHSLFDTSLQPVPWLSLVWPSGSSLAAWSPALLAVTLFAALVWVHLWRRTRPGEHRFDETLARMYEVGGARRQARHGLLAAAFLAGLGLLMALYCLAGHFHQPFDYLEGLDPATLLTYPEWLLAAAGGITFGIALRRWHPTATSVVSAALAALVAASGAFFVVRILPARALDYQPASWMRQLIANIPNQQQYRVVANDPSSFENLNNQTTTPQTNGYQGESALNPNFQYWLAVATSQSSWNDNERAFLLDWYGAKWVFTNPGEANASPYATQPANFRRLGNGALPIGLYELRHPRPIASLSTAPVALFVGDENDYLLFLQALAAGDVGSGRLVPVYVGSSLDQLTAAELATAHRLFVYGAAAADPVGDAALLRPWVSRGGRLVLEVGDGQNVGVLGPAAGAILPVRTASVTTVTDWQFHTSGGLFTPAAVHRFSPPSYGSTGAWQLVTASRLEPGSTVLLSTHHLPVVVSRTIGRGEVIWGGLNLPYHAASFKNAHESAVLAAMVGAAGRAHSESPVSATVRPEQVSSSGQATGLLVKETLTGDWRATVDGKAAPVEMAGPGMMYVPLPAGRPGTVVLSYHLSAVELLGIAVSLLSAAALVAVLVALPLLRRRRRQRRQSSAGFDDAESRLDREHRLRRTLQAAILDHDPDMRILVLGFFAGEPLEPYADTLLRLALVEEDPRVRSALVQLVRTTKRHTSDGPALLALRTWADKEPSSVISTTATVSPG